MSRANSTPGTARAPGLAASLGFAVLLALAGARAVPLAHAQSAAAAVSLEGGKLVLPGPIVFQTGTATLAPESEPALAAAAAWLVEKDYVTTVRVEGHTDGAGDAAAAQVTSEQRAMAVARALVAKGVACGRVLPVGFGGTKPVAENRTAEGRAANTRVELHNAALRGRAIGGMPLDGGGQIAGDPCK